MRIIITVLLLGGFLGLPTFMLGQEKELLLVGKTNEALQIHFHPVFGGKKIRLDEPLKSSAGDSLSLHTLRFYLSNFVFFKNKVAVFEVKNSQHLMDLEDEETLILKFQVPKNLEYDLIQFNLGIDSLTHISGAMGGDLDPTKGMFWTWQSGYINVKLEGFSAKCPARNHEFQFHLGGYLAPFQSVQTINLSVPNGKNLQLNMDLAPFFDQVDWAKKHSIMSPSREAVALSQILAISFSLHAK